jgi:hypothetical protein
VPAASSVFLKLNQPEADPDGLVNILHRFHFDHAQAFDQSLPINRANLIEQRD